MSKSRKQLLEELIVAEGHTKEALRIMAAVKTELTDDNIHEEEKSSKKKFELSEQEKLTTRLNRRKKFL